MKPLVSIIIPVYNKEKWIVQTLRSVASQTYENWECLIIDDGSTDNSLSLINTFTDATRGNWKIISQINSGQSHARNVGIEKATGEFVAFLDGDDLWLANKLKEQVDVLVRQPNVDALISGFAIFEVGQTSGFRVVSHKSAEKMLRGWLNMRGFGGLIESTGIVKRTTLSTVGKYDEELSTSAGLDLGLRLLIGSNLVTSPRAHVLYRLSSDQWHKDEHELRKDMTTLAERYAIKLDGLNQIHKWHNSYFFWLKMEAAGNLERIRNLLFSLLALRVRDWLMFYSLVSRNVLAMLRGKRID
ncbi:MAG: glycosyltransferase family 2 protein, partial [Patescibacteria group bacterium]